MCNRYVSPEAGDMERHFHLGARNPWRGGEVFPRGQGPFVRTARAVAADATGTAGGPQNAPQGREMVLGQWGLVPWFAKSPKLPYATNNACSEEVSAKATFKFPWAHGQRCLIPAWSFDEPNWESGKNVWWRFRRADGQPWGLAGLWNTWTDKATGEILESYTMLTLNADQHPLMNRMHKLDPKLGRDQQDKRSVVVIEQADADVWLLGSTDEAAKLIRLAPTEIFEAGPAQA
jgi:putative SOS response-associated peptidase YedK